MILFYLWYHMICRKLYNHFLYLFEKGIHNNYYFSLFFLILFDKGIHSWIIYHVQCLHIVFLQTHFLLCKQSPIYRNNMWLALCIFSFFLSLSSFIYHVLCKKYTVAWRSVIRWLRIIFFLVITIQIFSAWKDSQGHVMEWWLDSLNWRMVDNKLAIKGGTGRKKEVIGLKIQIEIC